MNNRIDPKKIGIPNICFSLTDKYDSDERKITFANQRIKRGFDDSETYSLRDTIANFILPRLKRYYRLADKTIIIEGEFRLAIEKAIKAFELIIEDDYDFDEKKQKLMEDGLALFAKYFLGLWW